MNYPFLYKILGQIHCDDIQKSLVRSSKKETVWEDWCLYSVQSPLIRDFLDREVPQLRVFQDQIYISSGTTSNFHYDRFKVYHMLHRVLVPLNNNFKYEWMVGDTKREFQPNLGDVILFNNMVPHRFVSLDEKEREVIYLDLYDPLAEDILSGIKGNYSELNKELDSKYKNI